MRHRTFAAAAVVFCLLTISVPTFQAALPVFRPGRTLDTGAVVLPDGRLITPAGTQVTVGGLPLGLALSPDGATLAVSNDGYASQSVSFLNVAMQNVISQVAMDPAFVGLAFSPDSRTLYASHGRAVATFTVPGAAPRGRVREQDVPVNGFTSGLAVSRDGARAFVSLGQLPKVATFLTADPAVSRTLTVSKIPYRLAVSPDGARLYVTNWGDDAISVFDATTLKAVATVAVGSHPSDVAFAPDGSRAYVPNANADTVSVIATSGPPTVTATIDLRPYPGAPAAGMTPDAAAVSPDGTRLYVTGAGDNDVAVIDTASLMVLGLIPTGWYPSAVAVSRDGGTLIVANARGNGDPANPTGVTPGAMVTGTVSFIPVPNATQLQQYTAAVRQNNRFPTGQKPQAAQFPFGPKSPIKHVVYIVRENKTYDEEFGDIAAGHGDPSLTIYPQNNTPNNHAIVTTWSLLDNFYDESDASIQGHEWTRASQVTDYVERTWQNYARGWFPDVIFTQAYPDAGYIFDDLALHHISLRDYGETLPVDSAGKIRQYLRKSYDRKYIGWDLSYPDVQREAEWQREFDKGIFPAFEYIWLPSDHTAGNTPGYPTPQQMVADSDYATGLLLDHISHSASWKSTLVVVVEDDPQSGADHISTHRSLVMLASPWIKRGYVTSTHYDLTSVFATMEKILGAPPMSQYDALAAPMTELFTTTPDLTPYTVLPENFSGQVNQTTAPLAALSAQQDWSAPDRVPDALLNTMVWQDIAGQAGYNAARARFPQAFTTTATGGGGDQ